MFASGSKTDIFALGSAIYEMVTGHEPFPELDSLDDSHEAEIRARYKSGRFPVLDPQLGGGVVHKCWAGRYGSASELADDLRKLIEQKNERLCVFNSSN
jgi:serine/threonine protein kinase